jgi:hypothetical protein
MTNKEIEKYIETHYRLCNQNLLLHSRSEIEFSQQQNNWNYQEVECGEITLLEVRTWNDLKHNIYQIAYTPYCEKNNYGQFIITVPKFEQLTYDDVYKAINYVLFNQLDLFLVFNIYFESVHISQKDIPIFKSSIDNIKEDIEFYNYKKFVNCLEEIK